MKINGEYSEFGFEEELFPRTFKFLEVQNVEQTERIPSRWRDQNLVLKVSCQYENYVVKKMNAQDSGETKRVLLMRKIYPLITPRLFLIDGSDCYTMSFIPGRSFFNLDNDEKIGKAGLAGKLLNEAYFGTGNFGTTDISSQVKEGFLRYREKRKQYFLDSELRLSQEDFEIFSEVPDMPSHNDLNAANLIYNEGIKLIDPSEEGYNDVSRDIGRYCASCFFNNYDYFGQDKKHSIEIARAFLENFEAETLLRAKYYMGESFLSFLGFNTHSTPKSVLKNLAINMLTRKGEILEILGETIQ